MDMPTNHEQGLKSPDRISNRDTSQTLSSGPIDRPFWRRVADKNTSRRTILQQLLGLLFGEVITPRAERSDWDAAADAEKLNSTNGNSRSVQDMGLRPILASFPKLIGRFIVARHQHGGLVDGPKHVNANPDIPPDFAKIPGPDPHVHRSGPFDQTPGRYPGAGHVG